MNKLPAQKHIETIRDALWCGTGFGRAAVMVGSGFSRNARPKTPTARLMPTWSGLTSYLYNRLNPSARVDSEGHKPAIIRSEATSEALKLADEFEAAFGRQQLEDALLEIIPDNDYLPGDLHRLLLRLPWAEVLTTNYDTLLERTREEVHERRYDLVERIGDIPRASRPRIVKLHGSFPSHRPFIISGEDFRTYPRLFAGFVNLAQQAAMENVLCLLGFSGEDPNFLQWTGWVRDHLGTASPRKVDAMTLMGEFLKRVEKNKGGHIETLKNASTGSRREPVDAAPTLADSGISKKESMSPDSRFLARKSEQLGAAIRR